MVPTPYHFYDRYILQSFRGALESKKHISISVNNKSGKGFSLIEVLVVIGIFFLIGGFALFVSMDAFRGSSFRSDRDLLVSALQRARAQAMNNICLGSAADCSDGKPHGVHIQSDKYVIFQGDPYSSTDPFNVSFDSSTAVTKNPPTPMDIIFEQLSGNTSCSPTCEITLTQGSKASTITVTDNGRIWWTN